MKLKLIAAALLWLLLGLALLATGCASAPPQSRPAVVPPPRIPALPAPARQPPPPAWCLPTCSDGWTRLADSLLPLRTSAASPAPRASAPTTH